MEWLEWQAEAGENLVGSPQCFTTPAISGQVDYGVNHQVFFFAKLKRHIHLTYPEIIRNHAISLQKAMFVFWNIFGALF